MTHNIFRSALIPPPAIPEQYAQRYREEGLWIDQTLPEFFVEQCQRHAESLSVVGHSHTLWEEKTPPTIRWTYAELSQHGWDIASRLRAGGVRPGDRVLLQLPNIAEYMSALLGIFYAGALPVFCMPSHRERELSHFARKTDAAAHIFSSRVPGMDLSAVYSSYSQILRDEGRIPPLGYDVCHPWELEEQEHLQELTTVMNTSAQRKSEQVAFLQLSGGTTGVSKLIPRTHADYLYSVRESAKICQLRSDSTFLVVLPASHNFTMSSAGILGAMYVGATIVFAADPSPQTAFSLIAQENVKVAALVPPLVQAWIASAQRRTPDLSSLELLQVGGAKLSRSVAQNIKPVLGATLQQVFGMAEGLVNYTRAEDSDELRYNTQGKPISAFDEILIVDDHDNPVSVGVSGHLLTRGPYTIRGYYDEPAINEKSFTEDGFYRSGDIVKLHPDGSLEVTGRAKDQINRNGEKIAVDEIEDLALSHPKIYDAIALGIPDKTVGERVCLVVVPYPGEHFEANAREELQHFFTEQGLASYKIPERVEVMRSLPTTKVGKISRKDVRAQLLETLSYS
ncbi:(2,3-dihydroxybenzoyl)adenylate synthase [Rothia sp. P7208]|uniref:(2,3-dihydroxybenzoyl)adenylate synthase n=1 Tax=Rothia sp. P7208 TaxID=3402660 RepID=UPI003ABFFFB7